jgi:hypothetical protein
LVFADNEYFWRWVARGFDRKGQRWRAARFYLRAAVKGRRPRDVIRAMGMIPILGWPVLLRRRIKAAAEQRARQGQKPSGNYAWLRAQPRRSPQPGSGVERAAANGDVRDAASV